MLDTGSSIGTLLPSYLCAIFNFECCGKDTSNIWQNIFRLLQLPSFRKFGRNDGGSSFNSTRFGRNWDRSDIELESVSKIELEKFVY